MKTLKQVCSHVTLLKKETLGKKNFKMYLFAKIKSNQDTTMSRVFNNLFYLTEQTSAFSLRMVAKNISLSLPPKDFTEMPKPIVNFLWNHKVIMNT